MTYPIKILGEIAKTTSGGTPLRSNSTFWGGKIPWLKSGELSDNLNINNSSEFITEEGLNKSSAKIFNKGTLLIAMYGATAGKLGILDFDATTNQAVCSIQNNKNLFIEKYVFLYLLMIRKNIIEDSFGGAQPNISKGYLDKIEIPLPPLSTQKLIVQKLDSAFKNIDESIKITRKNIENIKKLNISVLEKEFNKLVSNFGLSSISKSVLNPKSDIVDGPFGSNLKSGEYQNKGIPLIRLQNVSRYNFIDKDIKYVSIEKYNQLKRHTYIKGDIVITKLGAPLGKACIVPDNFEKGVIVADIIRVRVNKEENSTRYITYMINSLNCGNQFISNTQGATRPRVKLTLVRELQIPVPPRGKQKEIVSYLDEVFEKNKIIKEGYESKLKDLEEMRQSILKEAFEGRLIKK